MDKVPFILAAAMIMIIEWLLLPVFHLQLKINLGVLFLLTVFSLDRESDKIFLILGLALLAEFKTGGRWGMETLSLATTILIMEALGKIVFFSSRHRLASFGWILLWYYVYAALYWGGEAVWAWKAEPEAMFLPVHNLRLWIQGSGEQLVVGTALFMLGWLFLKKRSFLNPLPKN